MKVLETIWIKEHKNVGYIIGDCEVILSLVVPGKYETKRECLDELKENGFSEDGIDQRMKIYNKYQEYANGKYLKKE